MERLALGQAWKVMTASDTPRDDTPELMARVLDDALATASLKVMGLSEDDWTKMAEAVSGAVAGGLRDAEQLQLIALDALAARREKLFREVFASSLSLDSGAALAGLPPDKPRPNQEG
jgi:hypothetical protein